MSKRTVSNDLQLLMDKKLLNKMGTTGRGTYYVLQRGNKGAKGANYIHSVITFLMINRNKCFSCLYRFGIHWNDNRQIVRIEQLENDRIRKAWSLLYHNKNLRHSMDKVYQKA